MKALEVLVKLDLKHAGDYQFVAEIIRKSNGELIKYDSTESNEEMPDRHKELPRGK